MSFLLILKRAAMEDNIKEFITGLTKDKRTLEMFRFLVNNAYIRVINYHNTDALNAERFETEIKYLSENFQPVRIEDLDNFFKTRKWPYQKAGCIPAIFEGYRSHVDTYARILDKYGFVGWFYIPSFIIQVPIHEQISFCKSHRLRISNTHGYEDGRIAMSEEEVKKLSENHVICCHTGTHYELNENSTEQKMRYEIIESKKYLESITGKPCDVFCWLAGEEYNHSKWAHQILHEAGYRYVVSNLKIEKIRND